MMPVTRHPILNVNMTIYHEISEAELDQLAAETAKRGIGRPSKYRSLEPHKVQIEKGMHRGISLPVLLDWLRKNHDVGVTLNTLRKYVIRHIGEDVYYEYLVQNGWDRPVRKPRKKSNTPPPATNASPKIDLAALAKPPVFTRSERN